MTAEDVEAAVDTVGRRFPELGGWVEAAAGGLTAGEGQEQISQASLQDFLWYYLPRKWDEEAWQPVAQAAARLLEALGLERYAAIARSQTTAEILEAWRAGQPRGLRSLPRRPRGFGHQAARHRPGRVGIDHGWRGDLRVRTSRVAAGGCDRRGRAAARDVQLEGTGRGRVPIRPWERRLRASRARAGCRG